jgi:transposase
LVPKRDQSGKVDKQLGITKAGDVYMRRLLVGCSQYILGAFGPDCDLRRFGLKLAARGGKNAKRRAVVAVARKLAVLLHCLWKSGAVYDPLYQQNRKEKAA